MLFPFFTKSCFRLNSVSVEPSYFLHTLADTLLDFANTNLYLQKACRSDASIEPDLSTPCDDTEDGVITVTQINTYVLPFEMILVTISIIFYSFWSDKAGKKRKIFIMMVMVGQILESALESLHSYWWSLTPMYAAVTSTLIHVLCGNRITMSIFGNMYLADVVDRRNRTMRLGVFSTMKILGYLVGDLVCGNMLHTLGFFWYYMTCCAVAVLATISGSIFIQDHSEPTQVVAKSGFSIRYMIHSSILILRKGNDRQNKAVTLALMVYTILLFISQGKEANIFCDLISR